MSGNFPRTASNVYPCWVSFFSMLTQSLVELLMIHFLKHTHYTKGDYILASFTDYKNLICPNETANKRAFSFSFSIFWQFSSCGFIMLPPPPLIISVPRSFQLGDMLLGQLSLLTFLTLPLLLPGVYLGGVF